MPVQVAAGIRKSQPDFSETNLRGDLAEIESWLKNNPPPDVLAVLETRCRLVVLEHCNVFPVDSQGISLARDITAMAEAGANLLKKHLSDASRPRERVFVKAGTQQFK